MTQGTLGALLALVALAGCSLGGSQTPSITLTTTPAPTATPTQPPIPTDSPTPTPSPPTPTLAIGLPGSTCINGYKALSPDDPKHIEGLDHLGAYLGLPDPLMVDDNRYFVGPDPENILDPRFESVERWYFKGVLSTDPTYRGRWLYEKRSEDRQGVSAVAPYDTIGYSSPDWSGFVGEGLPRVIPGLPGLWSGIQYDFVTGEGDSGYPSLPKSQSECLLGT